MSDIATLGLAIDSRQATTATKALDDLTAAAKPAAKAAEDLGKATKPAATAAADLAAAATAAAKGTNDAGKAVNNAASGGVKNMVTQTGLARHELINLSRQLQDVGVSLYGGMSPLTVLAQQGGQIADVFSSTQGTVGGFLKQIGSGIASVLTPARLLAGGIAAVGAVAVSAASSWTGAQREVQLGLMGIGRASGATVGDINKIADATSSWGGLSVSQARDVATALAATGKIGTESIGRLTGQTRDFAAVMGMDVPKAAETLATIFSKPSEGAKQLAGRLGGIDAATVKYIETLEAQGDRQGAVKALIDAMSPSLTGAAEKTGALSKSWNVLTNVFSNGYTAIGKGLNQIGTLGLDEQDQNALEKQRDGLQKLIDTAKDAKLPKFDVDQMLVQLAAVNAALQKIQDTKKTALAIDASSMTNAIAPLISSLEPGPDVIRNMTAGVQALSEVMSKPEFEEYRKKMGDQLPAAFARARSGLDALTANPALADPIKSQLQSLSLQNKLLTDQSPAMRARVEYQLAYNDAIKTGSATEAHQIATLRAAQASGGPMAQIQQQTTMVALFGVTPVATEKSPGDEHDGNQLRGTAEIRLGTCPDRRGRVAERPRRDRIYLQNYNVAALPSGRYGPRCA